MGYMKFRKSFVLWIWGMKKILEKANKSFGAEDSPKTNPEKKREKMHKSRNETTKGKDRYEIERIRLFHQLMDIRYIQ